MTYNQKMIKIKELYPTKEEQGTNDVLKDEKK